jgi:ribosomal protein S27E
VELRCPVCQSERLVVVLRSYLVLCRTCGWRWLESGEDATAVVQAAVAAAAGSPSTA